MKTYLKDPRIISLKYPTRCHKCLCNLYKDSEVVYYPATKSIYCMPCGEQDYMDFVSSAMDEEAYHGRGNPM